MEESPVFQILIESFLEVDQYILLLLLFPSFMSLPPLYEDIMVWTYQLSMVEEDPRCPSGQFSGSSGHLGRTTDVPQASWLASSHERS